ncbi:MAG: hypothetical protein K6G88_12825 [Lachnospiraceae bacterium]|nr:hypothetical protein [Lachnospiraceae bacterium]
MEKQFDNIITEIMKTGEKPSDELYLETLKRINLLNEKNKTDKADLVPIWKRRTAIAFCAILCLSIIGTGTFAADKLFTLWGQKVQINKYVKYNIFTDTDEHMIMTVEELLSDGVCVEALVKYQARDKYGEDWLKNRNMAKNRDNWPVANFMIHEKTAGAAGYNTEFLEKYSTNSVLYYTLSCKLNERTNVIDLSYDLPSQIQNTTELSIECNVPVLRYNLIAEDGDELSRYVKPMLLEISPLSYSIWGNQEGMYEITKKNNNGGFFCKPLLPDEEIDNESITDITIIDSTGSYTPKMEGLFGIESNNSTYNYLLYSDVFTSLSPDKKAFVKNIDINNLKSLQLSNSYKTIQFRLEK